MPGSPCSCTRMKGRSWCRCRACGAPQPSLETACCARPRAWRWQYEAGAAQDRHVALRTHTYACSIDTFHCPVTHGPLTDLDAREAAWVLPVSQSVSQKSASTSPPPSLLPAVRHDFAPARVLHRVRPCWHGRDGWAAGAAPGAAAHGGESPHGRRSRAQL